MITTAWYDLTSRLQSNHVVLQRRADAPRSWLNKQRQMVNGEFLSAAVAALLLALPQPLPELLSSVARDDKTHYRPLLRLALHVVCFAFALCVLTLCICKLSSYA